MVANPVVAFEGPSGAGKSTLVQNVNVALGMGDIVIMPDYTVTAGGPEHMPPAPAE